MRRKWIPEEQFRGGKSDLVYIIGEIRITKDKAYFFYDGSRTVWLARALVEWDAVESKMAIPEWLAKDKELI